jgi:hypothetical protein
MFNRIAIGYCRSSTMFLWHLNKLLRDEMLVKLQLVDFLVGPLESYIADGECYFFLNNSTGSAIT